jgi:hypothetical protein
MIRACEKSPKIDAEIVFEKQLQKSLPNFEFGLHFALPKPSRIATKSVLKRSSFRDAMQPARNSAQINGSRRL